MIFGFGRAPGPLAIRPAGMPDAHEVAEIHAAAFDRPWGLIEFERLMAAENTLIHVAVEDHGPGVAGFMLSRLAADEAEVLSIAVHPRRRGQGVAGRLMAAHARALVLNRIRTLFLEVEEGNAPAIALYRRQGFAEVSRRDAYYRKADGSAATAIVMRRAL